MRAPAYQPLALFCCKQFLGTVRGIHIGRCEMAIEISQALIRLDMLLLEFLQLFTGRGDLLDEFLLSFIEFLLERTELITLLLCQIQARNNLQYSRCRATPSARATLGTTLRATLGATLGTAHTARTALRTTPHAGRTPLRTAHTTRTTLGTAHTARTALRTTHHARRTPLRTAHTTRTTLGTAHHARRTPLRTAHSMSAGTLVGPHPVDPGPLRSIAIGAWAGKFLRTRLSISGRDLRSGALVSGPSFSASKHRRNHTAQKQQL